MNLLEKEDKIINAQIIRGIKEIGFTKLTPIQEEAIPALLAGEDIIGQAQTGTGKTAAFGIPLIQNIDTSDDSIQGLVLCPTRELAIQASEELRKFSKYLHGVKILPVYGGADISRQIRSLKSKVSIVVGTPGRVMDHMRRHTIKLKNLKMLVLDEADEMLNMGFREDIETILKDIPGEHQTALFSATMPKGILDITNNYLKPEARHIKIAAKELTMPLIKQYYYEVNSHNKDDVAVRLLEYYNPKRSLIFCNTKAMVDKLSEFLKSKGFKAEGLHGDLSQYQRDKVMNGFRSGNTGILIATDVAARGIDVDDVEAVINYDLPQDIEYYVHRIGRTGRAGREGRAFSLVVGKERYRVREIERVCKSKMKLRNIPDVADVISSKASKIFSEIRRILEEEDITGQLNIIKRNMMEDEISTEDIAASLLKMVMGENPKEIIIERYRPKRYNENERRGYDRKNSRSEHGGRSERYSYKKEDKYYSRSNDNAIKQNYNRKKNDFRQNIKSKAGRQV